LFVIEDGPSATGLLSNDFYQGDKCVSSVRAERAEFFILLFTRPA
jgi:hypothetical protein